MALNKNLQQTDTGTGGNKKKKQEEEEKKQQAVLNLLPSPAKETDTGTGNASGSASSVSASAQSTAVRDVGDRRSAAASGPSTEKIEQLRQRTGDMGTGGRSRLQTSFGQQETGTKSYRDIASITDPGERTAALRRKLDTGYTVSKNRLSEMTAPAHTEEETAEIRQKAAELGRWNSAISKASRQSDIYYRQADQTSGEMTRLYGLLESTSQEMQALYTQTGSGAYATDEELQRMDTLTKLYNTYLKQYSQMSLDNQRAVDNYNQLTMVTMPNIYEKGGKAYDEYTKLAASDMEYAKAYQDMLGKIREPEEVDAEIEKVTSAMDRQKELAAGADYATRIQGGDLSAAAEQKRNEEAYQRYQAMLDELYEEKNAYWTQRKASEMINAAEYEELSRKNSQTAAEDMRYGYINGDVSRYRMASEGGGADTWIEQMTGDEVGVYNAIYASEGAETASQYLDALKPELEARASYALQEEARSFAQETPALASAATVGLSLFKGAGYLAQMADYAADRKIDANADYNWISDVSSSVRSEVSRMAEEKWGKVGSFAYQTGMSMGDFILSAAVTGGAEPFTLAIMGTGAASDSVLEAKRRGLTDSQAFLLGTVAGAAEIVTEKVSLDTVLARIRADDVTGFKNLVKNVLLDALPEGTEEIGSDVINLLADIIISGDRAEFIRKAQQEGFCEAITDFGAQLLESFAGGFLSGGVMSGATIGGVKAFGAAASFADDVSASMFAQAVFSDPLNVLTRNTEGTGERNTISRSREMADNIIGEFTEEQRAARIEAAGDNATMRSAAENDVIEEYAVTAAALAAKTGRDVIFYRNAENPYQNGYYDAETGDICINAASVNPMTATISHELTHSLEQAGDYEAFEGHVFRALEDAGYNIDRLVSRKQELYKNGVNQDLTEAEARKEITAEFVENYLLGGHNMMEIDSAAIFDFAKSSRTMAQRAAELITTAAAALHIKNIGVDLGGRTAKTDTRTMKLFNDLRNIYSRALSETDGRSSVPGGELQYSSDYSAGSPLTAEAAGTETAVGEATEARLRTAAEESGEMGEGAVYSPNAEEPAAGLPVGGEGTAFAEESGNSEREYSVDDPDAVDEAVENGGTVRDASGNVVLISDGNGHAQYSISSYDAYGRQRLRTELRKQVESGDITQEEMDAQMDEMERLYQLCSRYANSGKYLAFNQWSQVEIKTDENGMPYFSCRIDNNEYKMNIDFSTICKKRRAMEAVLERMVQEGMIDSLDMSKETMVKINDVLREHGMETACYLCFVETARYRLTNQVDSFVDKWNSAVDTLNSAGAAVGYFNFGEDRNLADTITLGGAASELETMSDGALADGLAKLREQAGKRDTAGLIARTLLDHSEYRKYVARGDFMSAGALSRIREQAPEIWTRYNGSKGVGGSKLSQPDAYYYSEILDQRRFSDPQAAYDVGGVRVQSFSDYIPRMVFDYMQMVGDMAAKHLPMHGYTKESSFVLQFGKTGIKINMSLIPGEGAGGENAGLLLDENGEVMRDEDGNIMYPWQYGQSFGSNPGDVQSGQAGYRLALEVQSAEGYRQNCGTIAIGISANAILTMLDDRNIRMIIPYHRSNLNPTIAVMNGVREFSDFSASQRTQGPAGKGGKRRALDADRDFLFNRVLHATEAEPAKVRNLDGTETEYWAAGDARLAADQYKDWCAANGCIPKFDEFSDHRNYYKLLVDFNAVAGYAADGTEIWAPQQAVQQTYPTEDDAFGGISELVEKSLGYDQQMQNLMDERMSSVIDELRQVLPAHEERFRGLSEDGSLAEAERYHEEQQDRERQRLQQFSVSDDADRGKTPTQLGSDINDTLRELDSEDMTDVLRNAAEPDAERLRQNMQRLGETVATYTEGKVTTTSQQERDSVGKTIVAGLRSFNRSMADSGEAIARVGRALEDSALYPMYNFARSASSVAAQMVTGRQTDYLGRDVGKGINEILDPLREKGGDYYRRFQLYLFHLHNVDRMSLHSEARLAEAQAALAQYAAGSAFQGMTLEQIKGIAYNPDHVLQEEARQYVDLYNTVEREQRMKNKPVFEDGVTAEMSRAAAEELLRQNPEFEGAAQEVYSYLDNLMQYRVDCGLVTQDEWNEMKALYPHYVPTYRAAGTSELTGEDRRAAVRAEGMVQVGKTVKRATGGDQILLPLHRTMADLTRQAVREGSLNRFGQRLLNDRALVSGSETAAEPAEPAKTKQELLGDLRREIANLEASLAMPMEGDDTAALQARLDRAREALRSGNPQGYFGSDEKTAETRKERSRQGKERKKADKAYETYVSEVRHVEEYDGRWDFRALDDPYDPETMQTLGRNSFVVRQGGRRYEMTLSKGMFEAVDVLRPNADMDNVFLQYAQKATTVWKKLVTSWNPAFMVRNLLKDHQEAWFNSRDLGEWYKHLPKAYAEIAGSGEYWRRYQALGGVYSSVFDYSQGGEVRGKTARWNVAGKLANGVEALNMAIEQAPRLAEFMATLDANGGLDADEETIVRAMYNAAEVTTNFGRGGKWGKWLNRNFVPFLNPNIQGFAKIGRNLSETNSFRSWAGLAFKATVFGIAPAVINAALYRDDDDWDELKERDKDIYYLFKIGEREWLKLPKGRVASVLGMLYRRGYDIVQGESVDWGETVDTVFSQVGPRNPFTDNFLAPILESDLFDNSQQGRTWYGAKIESDKLHELPASERYDAKTDKLSRILGEWTNLSPKKLNYVIDQYSGFLGDILLPMMTPAYSHETPLLAPFLSNFAIDEDASNRLAGDWYELGTELAGSSKSAEATAADAAAYKWWSSMNKDISSIYARIHEIEADETLGGKEKAEMLNEQYRLRDQAIRSALASKDDYFSASAEALEDGASAKEAEQSAKAETYGVDAGISAMKDSTQTAAKNLAAQGYSKEDLFGILQQVDNLDATGTARKSAIRTLLQGADYDDDLKHALYNELISDKHDDEIAELEAAGLGIDDWLRYEGIYAGYKANVGDAVQRKTDFARALQEDTSLTQEQRDAVWHAVTGNATTTKYQAMLAEGVPSDIAYELAAEMEALEPLPGASSVSKYQKWSVIADSDLSTEEQITALGVYMEDSDLAKVKVGVSNGITPADYVHYKDLLWTSYDLDDNGTITQAEAEACLDDMDMSNSSKAVLWQLANKSWRGGNNPYSSEIGATVYSALHGGSSGTATSSGGTSSKRSGTSGTTGSNGGTGTVSRSEGIAAAISAGSSGDYGSGYGSGLSDIYTTLPTAAETDAETGDGTGDTGSARSGYSWSYGGAVTGGKRSATGSPRSRRGRSGLRDWTSAGTAAASATGGTGGGLRDWTAATAGGFAAQKRSTGGGGLVDWAKYLPKV